MKTKTKTKGFGTSATVTTNHQTFYCECLFHNPQTDEEELVEMWRIKVDKQKFDSASRKSIAFAFVYCFLETEESKRRGINRVFIWNNGTGKYEPLGAISDKPLEDSEALEIEEVDPSKAYKRLSQLIELEVSRC